MTTKDFELRVGTRILAPRGFTFVVTALTLQWNEDEGWCGGAVCEITREGSDGVAKLLIPTKTLNLMRLGGLILDQAKVQDF